MILSVGVKNYHSIGDIQYLIMNASSQTELEESLLKFSYEDNVNRVNPLASIYGGNGTGKSNFLKAIEFVKNSITNSKEVEESIDFNPCKFKKELNGSEYSINFVINGKRYLYEFSHNEKSILTETLVVYKSTHPTKIYKRIEEEYEFSVEYNKFRTIARQASKPNNLFLNTLSILSNDEVIKEVYLFFKEKIVIENVKSKNCKSVNEIKENFINYFEENIEANKKVKEIFSENFVTLLKIIGDGISGFAISRQIQKEGFLSKLLSDSPTKQVKSQQIKILKELLKENKNIPNNKLMEELVSSLKSELFLVYKTKDGEVHIPFKDESGGIIKLFDVGLSMSKILSDGGIYIYDEIETCFHPNLLKKIIKLFSNKKINRNNAQLIFTTHNTNLLDLELFRRDQIWFMSKGEESEYTTELINLSSIRNVRKTENVEKGYLEGKYVEILKDINIDQLDQLSNLNEPESELSYE